MITLVSDAHDYMTGCNGMANVAFSHSVMRHAKRFFLQPETNYGKNIIITNNDNIYTTATDYTDCGWKNIVRSFYSDVHTYS